MLIAKAFTRGIFRCRPLNYIPIPVLNGLFLYLAVTALSGCLTEGKGLLKLITCVGLIFTALLRKPVVRADNSFVHGANCLPPKPLYQVAELKVETLNVHSKPQMVLNGPEMT